MCRASKTIWTARVLGWKRTERLQQVSRYVEGIPSFLQPLVDYPYMARKTCRMDRGTLGTAFSCGAGRNIRSMQQDHQPGCEVIRRQRRLRQDCRKRKNNESKSRRIQTNSASSISSKEGGNGGQTLGSGVSRCGLRHQTM